MGTVDFVKTRNDCIVTYELSGRLDTQSSPKFQDEIDDCFLESEKNHDKLDLILNFQNLNYLSSAGLRTILYTKKKIDSIGNNSTLKITNVQPEIMEIFDMTGFNDFLSFS